MHKFKSQRTVLLNGFSKLGEEGLESSNLQTVSMTYLQVTLP